MDPLFKGAKVCSAVFQVGSRGLEFVIIDLSEIRRYSVEYSGFSQESFWGLRLRDLH